MAKEKNEKKDRRADIEELSAVLFAQMFATSGTTLPVGLAKKAIQAARDFYAVCDESTKE